MRDAGKVSSCFELSGVVKCWHGILAIRGRKATISRMSQTSTLRILTIIPYFAPAWAYGGPVRVAYEITQRLAARGHKMIVFTTDALNAAERVSPRHEVIHNIEVYRFPNWSNWLAWRRMFMPRGMRRMLNETMKDVDLVHLHEFRSALNTQALTGLSNSGVPFVISAHGGMPLLGRALPKRIYDAAAGERLLQEATHIHAISRMEQDQLIERGVESKRITLIPNGIDPDDHVGEVDVSAFKAQHGLPEGCPVVGYVARLNVIKGPDVLIEAFASVVKTIPDAMLMLAGPDDGMKSTLEAQIRQLGLEDCVRFTGYLSGSDRLAAYRASDVYVLPSRYDIFGITVLEALLAQTPVIVSDHCGLADVVHDAGLGRVAPGNDPAQLAEQIIDTLVNEESAREQARHARDYVFDHYHWNAIADQWETLYCSLAGERVS